MNASNKEQNTSKQLPCSLVAESTLTVAGIERITVAGIERKTVLRCSADQHHIYCPAYYQNLIDDAEAALAELQERPVCDCHTWPTWSEMHGYIEALERKLAECERDLVSTKHIENLQRALAESEEGLIYTRDERDHILKKLAECERENVELKRRLTAALDPTWPTEAGEGEK